MKVCWVTFLLVEIHRKAKGGIKFKGGGKPKKEEEAT